MQVDVNNPPPEQRQGLPITSAKHYDRKFQYLTEKHGGNPATALC